MRVSVGVGIGVAAAAIAVALFVSLGQPFAPSGVATTTSTTTAVPPVKQFTIIAGEIELSGPYGFAFKGDKISSPGPTITVRKGDRVTITFTVGGKLAHTFAVTTEKTYTATPLWGAKIGESNAPVNPGQSGSVTFVADTAGTFFYICAVPGHAELGMFGSFVVEP